MLAWARESSTGSDSSPRENSVRRQSPRFRIAWGRIDWEDADRPPPEMSTRPAPAALCRPLWRLPWLLALCAVARAGTVHQIDFEPAEGYAIGAPLIGQDDWTGISPLTDQASGVAADPVNHPTLGQFGYIGGYEVPVTGVATSGDSEAKQALRREIVYTPGVDGGQVVTITLQVVPFYDSPYGFDLFPIALVNSFEEALCTVTLANLGEPEVLVMDQMDAEGAEAAGVGFEAGTRYELRYELDFGANQWSAWLGGAQVAADRQLFAPGMLADLGAIEIGWGRVVSLFGIPIPDGSSNHYLLFDQLRVTADPPPPAAPAAALSLATVPGTLDVEVSIRAAPGSTVVLQYSPTLVGGWTDLATLPVPAGGVAVHRHAGARAEPNGFYRAAAPPGG